MSANSDNICISVCLTVKGSRLMRSSVPCLSDYESKKKYVRCVCQRRRTHCPVCPLQEYSIKRAFAHIVQELCESRGGRPAGLSVLTSLLVSVDVKQHRTMLRH